MDYNKRRFEEAVKHGSDEDIREAARVLRDESISHRDENAEFMAEQLRSHKHARGFGDTAQYDGVKVRAGTFSKIEVDDEPEPEHEIPARRSSIGDYEGSGHYYDDDGDDDEDEEEDI